MTPFFVAMFLVLSAACAGPKAPPPELTRDQALLHAENAHEVAAGLSSAGDAERRERLLTEALRDYTLAAASPDTVLNARALFGRGQIHLLRRDTSAALGDWQAVIEIHADEFQNLRAMKALADAHAADGRDSAAQLWYRRIVSDYADREMTQQTRIIVEHARRKLKKKSAGYGLIENHLLR